MFGTKAWANSANPNSVDTDQSPQNTASDQGLHCSLRFLLFIDASFKLGFLLQFAKRRYLNPHGQADLENLQDKIDIAIGKRARAPELSDMTTTLLYILDQESKFDKFDFFFQFWELSDQRVLNGIPV